MLQRNPGLNENTAEPKLVPQFGGASAGVKTDVTAGVIIVYIRDMNNWYVLSFSMMLTLLDELDLSWTFGFLLLCQIFGYRRNYFSTS